MQSISQLQSIKEVLLAHGADKNEVNKVMRRYARSGLRGKYVAKRFINEVVARLGVSESVAQSLLIAQLEEF